MPGLHTGKARKPAVPACSDHRNACDLRRLPSWPGTTTEVRRATERADSVAIAVGNMTREISRWEGRYLSERSEASPLPIPGQIVSACGVPSDNRAGPRRGSVVKKPGCRTTRCSPLDPIRPQTVLHHSQHDRARCRKRNRTSGSAPTRPPHKQSDRH